MTYRQNKEIPVVALSALWQNPKEFARKILELELCKWLEQGRLSQSQAAEIANVSKQGFPDLLEKNDASSFLNSSSEIDEEAGLLSPEVIT